MPVDVYTALDEFQSDAQVIFSDKFGIGVTQNFCFISEKGAVTEKRFKKRCFEQRFFVDASFFLFE